MTFILLPVSPVLQASLESTLRHEPLAAVPILFAAGLATSLTPCVYPMIPITAGILGGAGASGIPRRRTAVLTAAYVGGLALVYSLLGLVAGLSGSLFGAIASSPWAYFVTGNHEYYSGFAQWIDEVARLGVRPLRNERLEIATRGGVFDLAGVNDLGGEQFGDGPNFDSALGDRDPSRPVVLMAHQPIVARDAARFGVDLQVSGHTHGGQMAPFGLLVKLEQPIVSGYGVLDGVPVYVTNGAGFWGPPVRVGVPPQVTLIELQAP